MGHLPQNGYVFEKPNSPMRVLHLVKGLGPGGAERLILNQLATSTSDIDYSVAYAIPEKDHLVSAITDTGAEVTRLDWSSLPMSLTKAIRAHRPHVVHAHSPLMAVTARLTTLLPMHSFAMVTTEHNRWPRHHRYTRAANRLTARLDDRRIAVSADVRNSMTPDVAASTEVIDHGIPLDEVARKQAQRLERRIELVRPEHRDLIIIGIVANFRPEKGYDTFLSAARHALDHSPDVAFIVVGQGAGEPEFRKAAADLDRLYVLGYRPDAQEVMSAFDVFTLSSRHEGKPVSLMEAFALGIPAVATRAGGIPEVVVDGENGLLVDVDDHRALAEAWLRVADDQALRERLAAGSRKSSSRFDASVATEIIESVYRSVASPISDR